ncbi:uncharacterized protein LOC120796267 isoform X2 [Xiphias gladius]|uniref:uncharacterized protein LOC120796267 isoform X2 n=1 Tax=Xiphias gladius TaxID=8245 RepID=UPI001A97F1AC|nr:uncharacterized protein LOC120796267 isoform X2 [Xiphias gladius]
MKDGFGAGEQAEVSRQDLYEDYVNCYLQSYTEVRPCRDARLLKKAARYLLRDTEPGDTFTVFPFYQVVGEDREPLSTDCRKHLCAFIKATELLETLCINLFLQPWKKEFRTLKTFTGPFVYCLLPVLNNSTIQSVLASIGYLPHTDGPQSEFRLSEDATPDRAILVGFELLLARVECYHLLESLEKDQLGPQVPLYLDTRLAVTPQPKPRHCHLISADQSIMEMQRTYPDLSFRGRLLVPDKPHQANTSRCSSKAVHTAIENYSDDNKVSELPKRNCIKGTKVASTSICSKNDGSKADEVLGGNGRSSVCNDRNSGGSMSPQNTTSSSFSNNDGSRVDDELSGPQAISLHITLRAGSKAEKGPKSGESQLTAGPPASMQQQAAAGIQNKRLAKPELPSLSSLDEEQELRELAVRMGQEIKDEVKTKGENKRGEENTNKERRKKEKKASTEGEVEEKIPRKPVMETGPAFSHDTSRCDISSQPYPAVMKEQKQPTLCHPSPLTVSAADCQSCKIGGSTGQQEGEDTERAGTGQGEEEQLAQSFVIVKHHKK